MTSPLVEKTSSSVSIESTLLNKAKLKLFTSQSTCLWYKYWVTHSYSHYITLDILSKP